ncbi:ABC transporter ATP-binding protein [Photobacterium lutimaris]|uniref:Sugar ABC transporter ATP-binding protein n=1 Tax=Photobacterium lutimaris TaxID=388278 RepID=A0A2T3IYV4_9GAMM|nr:sn-glycerol-3-phosphate ABC transporter ATP-binding protein UgpC [Photobacterium lutimaris]PSU33828.1 sugar ABC transporter ATP-binding protein [Photobacterium lutimaris]TDR76153.1 carbohydrate ABC transporter ATP-binding protein (CUT1 family) [Photobacterium lutimaris]
MAQVKLQNINKIYKNGYHAVHDFCLDIKDGEFMVLVGPSGCAKSTTLRMIAGLESISSGDLHIGDKHCNDVLPKDRGIAMVFQNYALYPHMTVRENLAFGLETRKKPKDEIERRVSEAAEILEISELLDRKPGQMSGGQCQRVALGRAMVRKPEVFLFDEPLSNLDAKLRVSMRMRISRLHDELKQSGRPATMIYVTHDQVEALTMGDRICVLNRGAIMQVDTPMNLYHKPVNKFVAEFIGSPTMNMLEGKLIKTDANKMAVDINGHIFELPEEKQVTAEQYNNHGVFLGLRPEHISMEAGENGYDANITEVEEMGSESFVYLDFEGKQMICKHVNPDVSLCKQSVHRISFNMDKCHIFDKSTEENIFIPTE